MGPMSLQLTDSWMLGPLEVPNRVLLAPLAGIGNWFVRLQAKRYGAGMAVSEMVSSHAIHHNNERTCNEMLRIHPDEQEPVPPAQGGVGALPGVVAIQLFGEDPAVMRSAAARVRAAGADVIDINMGCPVPKVQKTGAGAALLADHDLAVALARAAREGGGGLPVTVKLRSGLRSGETDGFELAHRLVDEAGVAAIGFHPRSAAVHHKGLPDYDLAARLVESLDAPVILTGGLNEPEQIREAFDRTGAAAVMLARGALGNPWLFERLLGPPRSVETDRDRACSEGPSREEVLTELNWTIDRAVEHLGEPRATRYLRKFYPWYIQRLELDRQTAKELQAALQVTETLSEARTQLAILLRSLSLLDGETPRAYAGLQSLS
jgi:tRNA-dihydrouridine synthase B